MRQATFLKCARSSAGVSKAIVRAGLWVRDAAERTSEGYIVEVCWWLDGLYLSANVELLHLVAKVRYRRMCGVVCSENLNGLVDEVRTVNVLHYAKVSSKLLQERETLPAMIAKGSSSRGSRKTKRVPGAMDFVSMSCCETSRVIGIGKSVPSARRSVSTTLGRG